jgi:uncharacterized protein (TIGR02145 family)
VTTTTVTTGGTISSDGGAAITVRGVCWSTAPNPTTVDNTTSNGAGTGSYSSSITGLQPSTTYYVRAYATNLYGTAYGNQVQFNTSTPLSMPGPGVTDINGNTYATIVLGNGQEWMAENLRVTTYANGDPIPNVMDNLAWGQITVGAWSYFNNSSQNDIPYGKLYNWYAVTDPRNVCPAGWHAPSEEEWTQLTDFLGGLDLAGGKLKTTGTQYWLPPNTGATDTIGFSGLPGGARFYLDGTFVQLGTGGNWWTTSENNGGGGWGRLLENDNATIWPTSGVKQNGLSVRCLRD